MKKKTTSDHEASANEEFLWTTTDNGVNARERSTRKRGGRKTKIIITIKMVRCIIIILIAVVVVVFIISMRIVLGVYLGSSSILLRDFLFACGFFPLFLLIFLRFSFLFNDSHQYFLHFNIGTSTPAYSQSSHTSDNKCLCLQMQNYKNQGKSFLNAQYFLYDLFYGIIFLVWIEVRWMLGFEWTTRFEYRKMSRIGVDFYLNDVILFAYFFVTLKVLHENRRAQNWMDANWKERKTIFFVLLLDITQLGLTIKKNNMNALKIEWSAKVTSQLWRPQTNFISNTDNQNSFLIICDTRTNFARVKWMRMTKNRMTKNVNKCALIGMTKNGWVQ